MQSRSKTMEQHSDISPLTHTFSTVIDKPTYKHHCYCIRDSNIQLTFTSHPCQKMHIKIIKPNVQQVFEISLSKRVLDEMDPGVIATFQTIQSMYNQFVQILKQQPSDFQILQSGIVKVKITVSLKSGTRKRQLILQTQRRQMTQIQKLRLQYEKKFQKNQTIMQQLAQKLTKTQNQLAQCRKQNKQLKTIINQLKKQLKQDVHLIQNKIKQERVLAQSLIVQLKENISLVKSNMGRIQFSVRGILDGGNKIILVPDKKSKCFKPGHKDNSFDIINQIENDYNQCKIIKTGKEKWAQLVFQKCIKEPMSYFDIQIIKSKNNYICVGIGSKSCTEQQDSKWSKACITIFLLDKSIICQGKSMENKLVQVKEVSTQNEKNIKIRVLINCLTRVIQWYENQQKIGIIEFSEDFCKLCQSGDVYPLIICADQDDQIILR